jgi:hypothetical protein
LLANASTYSPRPWLSSHLAMSRMAVPQLDLAKAE